MDDNSIEDFEAEENYYAFLNIPKSVGESFRRKNNSKNDLIVY